MAKWRYGVFVDAGSSGSRLHVYRWLDNGYALQEAGKLELQSLPEVTSKKKWTLKIKPGISTFGEKPAEVGSGHLKELVDYALNIVPKTQTSETPIYLLATAGMRLLPDDQREALLGRICDYLQSETEFLVSDCAQHVQVISGETEGLYGWIAANYLLKSFDAPKDHDHGKGHHTYGFLDMGGASAQIAFAPNATEVEKHANDLKLVRFRNLNGEASEYRVFVTTWLEFGADESRRRYIETLLAKHSNSKGDFPDPCLPTDLRISTKGDILSNRIDEPELQLVGTGRFDECLRLTHPLLNKDKPCLDEPCLLNGVHVPSIDFNVNHFVGVSEYWHTTHEIFEMAHKDKAYDFETYQHRVSEFCSQSWGNIKNGIEDKKWGKKVDEKTAAEVCFKASWIINILHEGIGVPRVGLEDASGSGKNTTKAVLDGAKDRGFTDAFQAVNKIQDTEVSWTLGRAVLYASSEAQPARHNVSSANTLPVGFGANTAGVPKDFQYAGVYHPPRPNATHLDLDVENSDSWHDTLFPDTSPRRIPGLLLFLFIICVAGFLLCGKERRRRLLRSFFPCFRRGSSRGLFATPAMAHTRRNHSPASERLLEAGLHDPDDFELNAMDDGVSAYDDDFGRSPYADDLVAGPKTGLTSGAATPAMRMPHVSGGVDAVGDGLEPRSGLGSAANLVGLGLRGPGVLERSGLIGRTDSRERLRDVFGEERSRSRLGSPARSKGR